MNWFRTNRHLRAEVDRLKTELMYSDLAMKEIHANLVTIDREHDRMKEQVKKLTADNQRLRWRHPSILPTIRDMPMKIRQRLLRLPITCTQCHTDEAVDADEVLCDILDILQSEQMPTQTLQEVLPNV